MFQYTDNEYIKLNRKILHWEWYSDPSTRDLFIHCILKANWKAGSWKGIPFDRGQFITSISALSKELGISTQNVRTALKHLQVTGELTNKSHSKYRVITVVNYNHYQVPNKVTNNQANKVLTNNIACKNEKITKRRLKSTSKLTSNMVDKYRVNTGFSSNGQDQANNQANKELTDNQQTTNKQLTTDRRRKEDKKIRNNISNVHSGKMHDTDSLDEFYESIWKLYPKKRGKGSVSEIQKKKLQKIGFEELKRCVERFVDDMQKEKRDIKFWKNGSSFFNSGYIDYLDRNYKVESNSNKSNSNETKEECEDDLVGDDW